jgi:hypothetical protein
MDVQNRDSEWLQRLIGVHYPSPAVESLSHPLARFDGVLYCLCETAWSIGYPLASTRNGPMLLFSEMNRNCHPATNRWTLECRLCHPVHRWPPD